MTITTSAIVNSNVNSTSWTDARTWSCDPRGLQPSPTPAANSQPWEQRLHVIHDRDDVSAGLPLHVEDHRGHAIHPGRLLTFSASSITFATSCSRTGAPLW